MNEKSHGRVKFFNISKGWGFIRPETGSDVFFHQDALVGDAKAAKIVEGYSVRYVLGKDKLDRPKAVDVEVLE